MFYPVSFVGRLFKKYLRFNNHPSKVRIQNFVGRHFFKEGLKVKAHTGTVLQLRPNDWISRMILLQDGYEQTSVRLAKDLLKDGGVFIDIGANFGLYTCSVSENANVYVYAVEPNYMVVPQLLENVRLNKRGNVKILNTALSDQSRFVSFDLPQADNLGSASFNAKHKATLSILSCSLNFIFESQQIKTADLMKIDIEGNEFDVLENFSFETYTVKNILLEFNELSGFSFEKLFLFFTGKGFTLQDIYGNLLNCRTASVPENNLWLVNTSSL